MRLSSITVGRLWGIPLQFHWSFVLIAIWVLWQAWRPGYGIDVNELLNLSLWIGLAFLSVVLHEYGHALMAKQFGIRTQKILIFPLGGGAFLERMPKDPRREIWVAFAGPMINIVMASVLALFIWLPGFEHRQLLLSQIFDPYSNVLVVGSSVLDYTIIVLFLFNLILAAFNLIPAYPLDGGRIFRVLLRVFIGPKLARRWSAFTGIAFSFGFMWVAYLMDDWVLGLGAGFICFIGFFELERARREAKLEGKIVADYQRRAFHPLYLKDDLGQARSLAKRYGERHFLLLDEWGEAQGLLSQRQLLQLSEEPDELLVVELIEKPSSFIHPKEELGQAYRDMHNHDVEVAIVSDGFRITGLLELTTIQDLL